MGQPYSKPYWISKIRLNHAGNYEVFVEYWEPQAGTFGGGSITGIAANGATLATSVALDQSATDYKLLKLTYTGGSPTIDVSYCKDTTGFVVN